MKKHSCLLLLFLCLFSGGIAQMSFFPGWIVVDETDTTKGFVRGNHLVVFFKTKMKATSTKYTYREVDAFKMGGQEFRSECFEVVQGNFPETTCGFLKLVETGGIELYYFKGVDVRGNRDYDNYYVMKRGSDYVRVRHNQKGFAMIMGYCTEDHPDLSRRIKDKEFSYDNLREIVIRYNDWFAQSSQ